jgi:hypothetical protein
MEFTSLNPSNLVEESILNGDLVCTVTTDSDCYFEIESTTPTYLTVDSTNGNVYLTGEGLVAINQDYPAEPYKEVTEILFTYIATQIQTGLKIYQDVTVPVSRIHDSPPYVINTFVEPTYTESLTDGMRIFEIRTAYPAKFTIIGDHSSHFEVPDINVGRIILTPVGLDYLTSLEWNGITEKVGEYFIQTITVRALLEDTENSKIITYDLELTVYKGSKDKLLPTKNSNELIGEALGDLIGKLGARLDIKDKEYKLELETAKMNIIKLLDTSFGNAAMSSRIAADLDNAIERLKEADNFQDIKFTRFITSLRNNLIEKIYQTISEYQIQALDTKSNLEVVGYDFSTNIMDSSTAKSIGYAGLDFAKYYSDYNKVWNQFYTDRKINLTLNDIDSKIEDMRVKINNNIINTYNGFFNDIVHKLNTNTDVIKENYNAILKLDYRGRESERWIGDHEARISTQEGYDLTDWDVANSWNFTSNTLKYRNYTHLMDDTSGNLTVTSNGTLTLRSGTTGITWNGTTLAVGNTKTVSAGIFNGTATKAKYADIAEYYRSDKEYGVGTILSFETDPEAEHEVCEYDPQKPLAGVVSNKPGFILNSEKGIDENTIDETWVQLALVGRVEIQCTYVKGEAQEITKGLYLYPDSKNTGKAFASPTRIPELELIGVTISNKDLDTGLVLAKV